MPAAVKSGQSDEKVLAGGLGGGGGEVGQHSPLPVLFQPSTHMSSVTHYTSVSPPRNTEYRNLIIFSLTFGQLIDNVNVTSQIFVFL